MSSLYSTEGIILKAISFREDDRILTLLTLDNGLIKVIRKKERNKKFSRQPLCEPLTRVEVSYQEKKGDLFVCENLIPLQSYLHLRKHLPHLEAGCDMLRAISSSQLAGKPAPLLYKLLLFYLDKIPHLADPAVLVASFRLKLLKHEGVLAFPLRCKHCHCPLLKEAYNLHQDFFCLAHADPTFLSFDQQELEWLERLAFCHQFSQVAQITLAPYLKIKIDSLFRSYIYEE